MNSTIYILAGVALSIAGVALCLLLFISLKRALRRADDAAGQQREETSGRMAQIEGEVQRLEQRLRRLEDTAERVASLPLAGSGLNLNKRSQALRMHRRGETPGRIAAALGLPEGEVQFLLKVQQLTAGEAANPPRRSPAPN